jgi:hypothetical protein
MHNLNHGIKCGPNVGFLKKSAQSKQSYNGRQFAQSGHPDLIEILHLKFVLILALCHPTYPGWKSAKPARRKFPLAFG